MTTITTYSNPIARYGDFADPFVLRHDGRYYLYCTNPDVRCWSSSDLVTWELEGPTIEDGEFPDLVPFAPEVVYADGWFYMYTSPSGHGHVVLRSDTPTGPFRAVSANVGHSIDGNVFIDDDGRWYFYWAGDEGIWGCEMPSPTEFGEPVFTGIHMNGWTEGPFVSKRDGWYHMTLTGNHYLSPGYRINAAFSQHPLSDYRNDPLNPILISTGAEFYGLGHSSSVSGPDVVSTYLVYHNMNPDASRDLDIDRQVWNGRSLQVLGPTSSAPVPGAPDYACNWSAGDIDDWTVESGDLVTDAGTGSLRGAHCRAIWDAAAGESFTAEINLTPSISTATYGLSLTLSDDGDHLTLIVHRDTHSVLVTRIDAGGSEVLADMPLPLTFTHNALHCWRLVLDDERVNLSLDGRHQASVAARPTLGSHLGIIASGSVRIGYCALTNTVAERADRAAAKPVPGRFWAALSAEAAPAGTRMTDAVYDTVLLGPSASLAYDIFVQRPGVYVLSLTGEFDAGDVIAVDVDGDEQSRIRIDEPSQVASTDIEFTTRHQRLRIRAVEGGPKLALVSTALRTHPSFVPASAEFSGCGKRLIAEEGWDDFSVSATLSVRFDSPDAHADILLRASQLSEGGEGDDPVLGIDFFIGYSVQVHNDRLVLARHGYDQQVLASTAIRVDSTVSHSIDIRVSGGTLDVILDGEVTLRHNDRLPHLSGGIGVRTWHADLRLEAIRVEARAAEPATAT